MRQAEEKNLFDKISDDMELVYNALNQSKELRNVLSNPVITEVKKKSILTDIFSDKISVETKNFLILIINKNREEFLYEISKRFLEIRDIKLNVVHAAVTAAVELDESEKELIEKKLAEYTGKKVRTSYGVDDKIIGGFLVKINDSLLDASITHQLELLKKRLVKENQALLN